MKTVETGLENWYCCSSKLNAYVDKNVTHVDFVHDFGMKKKFKHESNSHDLQKKRIHLYSLIYP